MKIRVCQWTELGVLEEYMRHEWVEKEIGEILERFYMKSKCVWDDVRVWIEQGVCANSECYSFPLCFDPSNNLLSNLRTILLIASTSLS